MGQQTMSFRADLGGQMVVEQRLEFGKTVLGSPL